MIRGFYTDTASILKVLLSLTAYILIVLVLQFADISVLPLSITFFVVLVYAVLYPRHILDPRNMVFAFFGLFLILPMAVDYFFQLFALSYNLPWGRPWDWSGLARVTYLETVSLYLMLMLFISFFVGNDANGWDPKYSFCFMKGPVLLLVVLTFSVMFLFVIKTGGVGEWFFSYKETFLKGRSGLGHVNFIFIFLSNLLIFILGLHFFNISKPRPLWLLVFSFFLIFVLSFFQGLKSRFIILSLIYFSPFLIGFVNSFRRLLFWSFSFFVLIYFFTYVRSGGFYDSPLVFIEYTMTYFNTFPLHDLVVRDGVFDVFSTIDHLLVKPAGFLGLSYGSDFDLSVMLTKEYYPKDWEVMSATQQWPLLTDLRYNYYGFALGWFFIFLYSGFLAFLYRKARGGDLAFLFIFVLEFVRIFSVLRGTLIPWQFFIYIPFYLFSFFFLRDCICRLQDKESVFEKN